jgi:hypothetical protein
MDRADRLPDGAFHRGPLAQPVDDPGTCLYLFLQKIHFLLERGGSDTSFIGGHHRDHSLRDYSLAPQDIGMV